MLLHELVPKAGERPTETAGDAATPPSLPQPRRRVLVEPVETIQIDDLPPDFVRCFKVGLSD